MAAARKRARPARPRAQGGGVLWVATRGDTGPAPPLGGWAAGQCGTIPCLAWRPAWLAADGKTALRLGWDKASWHVSQAVRGWLKTPPRHVKQAGGCRVVVAPLPLKSPWLPRIEPQ